MGQDEAYGTIPAVNSLQQIEKESRRPRAAVTENLLVGLHRDEIRQAPKAGGIRG
jgi:hypothetical protein